MGDTFQGGTIGHPKYEVITIEDPPYVIKTPDGRPEGMLIDLLTLLSKTADFTYDLKIYNGTYGHQNSQDEWEGLIGQLVKKSADIAVGAIAVTSSRESVVKFSQAFDFSRIKLLFPRPQAGPELGASLLLLPFSASCWVLLVLALLLVSTGFFLIGRFSPYEWSRIEQEKDMRRARYSFGLRGSLLFVFSTFGLQGYREAPKSLSGRALAVAWWIFSLFVLLAYVANLTALVSSRPHQQASLGFRNFDDILQDRDMNIGIIRHSETDLELRISSEHLQKRLHEYVRERHNWVGTLEEGLNRVRESNGKFGLLLPALKADYLASENCDLVTFGSGLGSLTYGFAFADGSYADLVRERVSSAIQRLRDDTTIEKLVQKWSRKGGHCTDSDANLLPVRRRENGLTFITMTPRDLAVPFLFLFLCGIFTAVIVALEILHSRGHFKLQTPDEEEAAAAEPLNKPGKAGQPATAQVEDEDGDDRSAANVKAAPSKGNGEGDGEPEMEPEEKEKAKEGKEEADGSVLPLEDAITTQADKEEKTTD